MYLLVFRLFFVISDIVGLSVSDDLIRYISVKPNASIHTLRQKIWHLLDLPDYCDEIIVLKTTENVEIPLGALRKGNEPNRPFILEVWLPARPLESMTTIHNHMLTMGRENEDDNMIAQASECPYCDKVETKFKLDPNNKQNITTITESALTINNLNTTESCRKTFTSTDLKKPDLSCLSNSSFLLKLQKNKSKENFSNVLLKIQDDLSTLSRKLSNLESKIPS